MKWLEESQAGGRNHTIHTGKEANTFSQDCVYIHVCVYTAPKKTTFSSSQIKFLPTLHEGHNIYSYNSHLIVLPFLPTFCINFTIRSYHFHLTFLQFPPTIHTYNSYIYTSIYNFNNSYRSFYPKYLPTIPMIPTYNSYLEPMTFLPRIPKIPAIPTYNPCDNPYNS